MDGNRAHARHDFDAPVEIVVDGEARPGRSVNISRGGIFTRNKP
jgi:hypothetical protein